MDTPDGESECGVVVGTSGPACRCRLSISSWPASASTGVGGARARSITAGGASVARLTAYQRVSEALSVPPGF
jgi:hypothetical protein